MLLLCMAKPSLAGFDYTAYQKTTPANITQKHQQTLIDAQGKSGHKTLEQPIKYRFQLNFSRQLRPISSENRRVINAWAEALRVKQPFIDLYQQEFKASFNGKVIWIPVQQNLLEAMGNELHTGDQFELYVLLIGASRERFVFLTTEFKSERILEY